MTTLILCSAAALAALAILIAAPVFLWKKRRKRQNPAKNVARRLVAEVRREYRHGTLPERQKVPAKVAFIRRFCAARGLVLSDAGTNDRELDRILKTVDVKTPDDVPGVPLSAFIPLGETTLDAGPQADEPEPAERSGVHASAAPKGVPRMVRTFPQRDYPEIRAALEDLGDDGIDKFVESEFGRIATNS